jgi:negative regulator of flagellin synthesis FlgM
MPDPIRGVNAADALGVTATDQSGNGNTATGATGSAAATPATDTADVSKVESLLAAIGTMSGSLPAVDQARVQEIQQSIANGTYQVNPQTVAQKMLELERLLGGNLGTGG